MGGLALVLAGGCSASLDNVDAGLATSRPSAALAGSDATPTVETTTKQVTRTVSRASAVGAGSADVSSLPGSEKPLKGASPGSPSYKIGTLDLLEVAVYKVPDLTRTVQVAENGAINLPLIGETNVAGMTAQELERDLAKKLGEKYLQKPQVSVSVKEFNSQRITIEGAVKKPGVYPLKGRTTLLQLIAQTEGLTEVAENEVALVRFTNGKRVAAKYDIDQVRSGASEDPTLLTGDMIIVGTSAIKTAFNNVLKSLPLANVLKPF
jgi:polysaccharide biosynthesis/export protein